MKTESETGGVKHCVGESGAAMAQLQDLSGAIAERQAGEGGGNNLREQRGVEEPSC